MRERERERENHKENERKCRERERERKRGKKRKRPADCHSSIIERPILPLDTLAQTVKLITGDNISLGWAGCR